MRLQTLQPLSSLSATSLAVTGGTVGTIMAVDGSQNKDFDVGISADKGADQVSVGTRSGVALVANALTIQIMDGNPQVCSLSCVHCPGLQCSACGSRAWIGMSRSTQQCVPSHGRVHASQDRGRSSLPLDCRSYTPWRT